VTGRRHKKGLLPIPTLGEKKETCRCRKWGPVDAVLLILCKPCQKIQNRADWAEVLGTVKGTPSNRREPRGGNYSNRHVTPALCSVFKREL